jgi:hypothetical protein
MLCTVAGRPIAYDKFSCLFQHLPRLNPTHSLSDQPVDHAMLAEQASESQRI